MKFSGSNKNFVLEKASGNRQNGDSHLLFLFLISKFDLQQTRFSKYNVWGKPMAVVPKAISYSVH